MKSGTFRLMTLFAAAFALALPVRGFAVDVLTLKYKARLYYVTAEGSKKKMGTAKGLVRAHSSYSESEYADLEFPVVEVDGQTVPGATIERFYVSEWNRPRVSLKLGSDALVTILKAANDAWYRSNKLERRVSALIEELLAEGALAEATASGSYTDYTYIGDSDDTVAELSFQSTKTGEILKLRMDFANRVRVR